MLYPLIANAAAIAIMRAVRQCLRFKRKGRKSGPFYFL
jgi:hypothetical protein